MMKPQTQTPPTNQTTDPMITTNTPAPTPPEDTPDAFTEKHVLPILTRIALTAIDRAEYETLMHQRVARLERNLSDLFLIVRKKEAEEGGAGLAAAIRDLGERLADTVEAIKDTGDQVTRGTLHAAGILPHGQTADLEKSLGMGDDGETLKS
jgi:hypothetical protein